MSISTTRSRLEDGLLAFAWDQWAQLGVPAVPTTATPWSQDLEALLVLTLEIARADPRLFDAVLDWLVQNERLISVRRWRTLATTPADRQLTEAVIAWLARHRPRARFASAAQAAGDRDLTALFPAERGFPSAALDEAFAAHGLRRAPYVPAGQARAPDLRLPIAFILRLRQLLGVGVRAEVMTVLLGSSAPRVTATVLARSAAYAKRNIQETLNALVEAGVVTVFTVGGEQRYGADRGRWAPLLGLDEPLPLHVDWVQLFAGIRRLVQWLRLDAEAHRPDGYLQQSEVRQLLEDVRPDFAYAGVPVPISRTVDAALADLDGLVQASLAALGSSRLRPAATALSDQPPDSRP